MPNERKGRQAPVSAKLATMIPADHRELLAKIPRELLLRVHALQPILRLNGSIQARKERDRKPTYRLRFRNPEAKDGHFQQSIVIPEEAVPGVQLMLIGFQGTHAQEIERERERKPAEELGRKLEGLDERVPE